MCSDNLRLVVLLSKGTIYGGTHVLSLFDLGKQSKADTEYTIKFASIDQPHFSIHHSLKDLLLPPWYCLGKRYFSEHLS